MNTSKENRASQYKVHGGKDQILATLTSLVDNSDTNYLPHVVVDLKNDTMHMKYSSQSQKQKVESPLIPSYKKANIMNNVSLNVTRPYQIFNSTKHRPSNTQNARIGSCSKIFPTSVFSFSKLMLFEMYQCYLILLLEGLPVAPRQNINYIKHNRTQNENQPGISKHTRRNENLHGEQQDIQITPNSIFPSTSFFLKNIVIHKANHILPVTT